MKKVLFAITAVSLFSLALSAKSFDLKFEQECIYILGDHHNGRYDEEAHGFSLGVIAGIKDALPAQKRSGLYRKSLGYISDRACSLALKDKSGESFVRRYQRAALRLLTK